MGTEIERKFLVVTEKLPDLSAFLSKKLVQGYLSLSPTVRVRIEQNHVVSIGDSAVNKQWHEKAYLTIKGPGLLERAEFEYPVPVPDAREMMGLSKTLLIHKTRYGILYKNQTIELDCFEWPFRGWLAEIELISKSTEVDLPPWLGVEVTDDKRYSNVSLASNGFPEVNPTKQDLHVTGYISSKERPDVDRPLCSGVYN